MPLNNGCDDDAISSNIEKLVSEGYKRRQAVAIALDHARRQGCKISAERMISALSEDE